MANLGLQDRWLNGLPATIQYVDTDYDLGSQDRWLNGLPAIIQTDEYVASGGVTTSDRILTCNKGWW